MAEQETPINDLEAQSIETQAETIAGKQVLTAIAAGAGISETTVNGNSTITNAGVLTFNTRSGAVIPASGDYTVSQITGIQSGTTASTAITTPTTITFAVAFAAAPTVVASAVADTATVAVTATTATTFTYEVATVASAVTWIAIAV